MAITKQYNLEQYNQEQYNPKRGPLEFKEVIPFLEKKGVNKKFEPLFEDIIDVINKRNFGNVGGSHGADILNLILQFNL